MIGWHAPETYYQGSADGYQVARLCDPAGDIYLAYGPPDRAELSYWKWLFSAPALVHYPIGTPVLQRRALLGATNSAAEARALCERHCAGQGMGEAA